MLLDTHFVEDCESKVYKLSDVTDDNIFNFKQNIYWLIDIEENVYFNLTENDIRDMLEEKIECQTEFDIEDDDRLFNIIQQFDFYNITKQLNEKFKKAPYHKVTDIQVEF